MYEQIDLFQFLNEIEKEMPKDEKKVMIENAINIKTMCDYVVSCSYSDIVLIICMLRDYVKMLDEVRNDIQWESYYRERFIKIADRFSEQIEYDYDAALEKCSKKIKDKQNTEDIGGDAMELMAKHNNKKKGK